MEKQGGSDLEDGEIAEDNEESDVVENSRENTKYVSREYSSSPKKPRLRANLRRSRPDNNYTRTRLHSYQRSRERQSRSRDRRRRSVNAERGRSPSWERRCSSKQYNKPGHTKDRRISSDSTKVSFELTKSSSSNTGTSSGLSSTGRGQVRTHRKIHQHGASSSSAQPYGTTSSSNNNESVSIGPNTSETKTSPNISEDVEIEVEENPIPDSAVQVGEGKERLNATQSKSTLLQTSTTKPSRKISLPNSIEEILSDEDSHGSVMSVEIVENEGANIQIITLDATDSSDGEIIEDTSDQMPNEPSDSTGKQKNTIESKNHAKVGYLGISTRNQNADNVDEKENKRENQSSEEEELEVLELRTRLLEALLKNQDSNEQSPSPVAKRTVVRDPKEHTTKITIHNDKTINIPSVEEATNADSEEEEALRSLLLSQLKQIKNKTDDSKDNAGRCTAEKTANSSSLMSLRKNHSTNINVIKATDASSSSSPTSPSYVHSSCSSPFSYPSPRMSGSSNSSMFSTRRQQRKSFDDSYSSSPSPEYQGQRVVKVCDEPLVLHTSSRKRKGPPKIRNLPKNDLRKKLLRNANLRKSITENENFPVHNSSPSSPNGPGGFNFPEFGVVDTDLRTDPSTRLKELMNNDITIRRTVNFNAKTSLGASAITWTEPLNIQIPSAPQSYEKQETNPFSYPNPFSSPSMKASNIFSPSATTTNPRISPQSPHDRITHTNISSSSVTPYTTRHTSRETETSLMYVGAGRSQISPVLHASIAEPRMCVPGYSNLGLGNPSDEQGSLLAIAHIHQLPSFSQQLSNNHHSQHISSSIVGSYSLVPYIGAPIAFPSQNVPATSRHLEPSSLVTSANGLIYSNQHAENRGLPNIYEPNRWRVPPPSMPAISLPPTISELFRDLRNMPTYSPSTSGNYINYSSTFQEPIMSELKNKQYSRSQNSSKDPATCSTSVHKRKYSPRQKRDRGRKANITSLKSTTSHKDISSNLSVIKSSDTITSKKQASPLKQSENKLAESASGSPLSTTKGHKQNDNVPAVKKQVVVGEQNDNLPAGKKQVVVVDEQNDNLPAGEKQVVVDEQNDNLPAGEKQVVVDEQNDNLPAGEKQVVVDEQNVNLPAGEKEVVVDEQNVNLPAGEKEVVVDEQNVNLPAGEKEVVVGEQIDNLSSGLVVDESTPPENISEVKSLEPKPSSVIITENDLVTISCMETSEPESASVVYGVTEVSIPVSTIQDSQRKDELSCPPKGNKDNVPTSTILSEEQQSEVALGATCPITIKDNQQSDSLISIVTAERNESLKPTTPTVEASNSVKMDSASTAVLLSPQLCSQVAPNNVEASKPPTVTPNTSSEPVVSSASVSTNASSSSTEVSSKAQAVKRKILSPKRRSISAQPSTRSGSLLIDKPLTPVMYKKSLGKRPMPSSTMHAKPIKRLIIPVRDNDSTTDDEETSEEREANYGNLNSHFHQSLTDFLKKTREEADKRCTEKTDTATNSKQVPPSQSQPLLTKPVASPSPAPPTASANSCLDAVKANSVHTSSAAGKDRSVSGSPLFLHGSNDGLQTSDPSVKSSNQMSLVAVNSLSTSKDSLIPNQQSASAKTIKTQTKTLAVPKTPTQNQSGAVPAGAGTRKTLLAANTGASDSVLKVGGTANTSAVPLTSKAIIDDLTKKIIESRDQLALSAKEKELLQSRQQLYSGYREIQRDLQQNMRLVNLDKNLQNQINEMEKKLEESKKRQQAVRAKATSINQTINEKSRNLFSSKVKCVSLHREVKKLGEKIIGEKQYKVTDLFTSEISEVTKTLEVLSSKQPQSVQLERGANFQKLLGALEFPSGLRNNFTGPEKSTSIVTKGNQGQLPKVTRGNQEQLSRNTKGNNQGELVGITQGNSGQLSGATKGNHGHLAVTATENSSQTVLRNAMSAAVPNSSGMIDVSCQTNFCKKCGFEIESDKEAPSKESSETSVDSSNKHEWVQLGYMTRHSIETEIQEPVKHGAHHRTPFGKDILNVTNPKKLDLHFNTPLRLGIEGESGNMTKLDPMISLCPDSLLKGTCTRTDCNHQHI